jgi:hypothetical protein
MTKELNLNPFCKFKSSETQAIQIMYRARRVFSTLLF